LPATTTTYDNVIEPSEPLISVFTLDGLCESTADTWCRSFGVTGRAAVSRLTSHLLAGCAVLASETEASCNVEETLHGLARAAIEKWFAACGFSSSGRGFDRLRHSFLRANCDGDWSEHFLDHDVDRERLGAALTAASFTATPAATYRAMPRQSL
jgi:hypothetical protein